MRLLENKVTRRVALGSIAGGLASVAVVLSSVRSRRRSWMESDHIPLDAIPTDLTQEEVKDAMDVLTRERSMWSRFVGMSGRISVEVESANNKGQGKPPHRLSGKLSLRQVELKSPSKRGLPWKYEMTISDDQNQWTMTTDGTKAGTQVVCQNKQLDRTIHAVDPATVQQLLTLPTILAIAFKDKLSSQGHYTIPQVFGVWNPWRNKDAQGVPHSYTFKTVVPSNMNELAFAHGHLSEFHKKKREHDAETSISFENHVESNGIWYPTQIQGNTDIGKYDIRLANIIVDARKAKT